FRKNICHPYAYSLENDIWEEGKWKILRSHIILDNVETLNRISPKDNTSQNFTNPKFVNGKSFECLVDKDILLSLNMFYSQITNRNIMKDNLERRQIIVNKNSFGKAKVIKNFSQVVYLK